MNFLVLFVAGFANAFTPGGMVFLVITILLPIVGILLKKRIFAYASLFTLGVILLLHLSVPIPFLGYIGPVQGALITDGSFIPKFIHNLGFVFMPLLINLAVLKFSGKKFSTE